MQEITPEVFMALPLAKAIQRCEAYLKEARAGKRLELDNPSDCPLSMWVVYNHAKCAKELVPTTKACPICGSPVCPDCMNHNVQQLSRVTGYLGTVSGWNESKKQEFRDRNRYEIEGENR